MNNPGARRGIVFVISAPSGTGKSTLSRTLLESIPDLRFSVSYTTRPRRAGEESGREYHFVDEARFTAMVEEGGFLEWAKVFGRCYGTGREATESALAAGQDLLLDIDVQGARQVRASGLDAVSVFVLPPSFAALESRLRLRGSDDAAVVAERLDEARREAMEYPLFDYVVVNAELEEAAATLTSIVRAERSRTNRRHDDVRGIIETFPAPRG